MLDRVSFRRFCGLSLEGATPDETTLCRFRNDLKASGLGEPLFAEVSRQFEAAGLTLRSGTLIDATLVESAVRSPAPGTTAKGEESRSPHDGDANWTRQGQSRRLFFGYKVHVGVDLGSGLIRSRLMTPAKTYESEVADQLIIGDEAAVYADKAYEKKTRRAALKARGIKDRIQHRRHKYQRQLPYWQTVRNALDRPATQWRRADFRDAQMRLWAAAHALPRLVRQSLPLRPGRHRLQSQKGCRHHALTMTIRTPGSLAKLGSPGHLTHITGRKPNFSPAVEFFRRGLARGGEGKREGTAILPKRVWALSTYSRRTSSNVEFSALLASTIHSSISARSMTSGGASTIVSQQARMIRPF